MRRDRSSSILPALAAFAFSSVAVRADLPSGFQLSPLFDNLNHPTSVRFAPDGRIFVAEKSGLIKLYESQADSTPVVFADLRTQVYDRLDRGLLAIEIDPGFPTRPYVYALYTLDAPIGQVPPVYGDGCNAAPQTGCFAAARLSRLTAAGDVVVGPELVLLEGWCQQFLSHSIGDVRFGPDSALYVTGGEGANFSTVDYGQFGNPCGDPPDEGGALRSQDLRTPGDPVGLNGAMLRIDPDTGAALPDNPLVGGAVPDDDRHIAYGFRNPFRLAFRPNSTEIWVGDVGWFG